MKEELKAAWSANIVEFLKMHHANEIKVEGRSARLKQDDKVVFNGNSYYDNNDHSHGGTVQALVKYFGYTELDAVKLLAEMTGHLQQIEPPPDTKQNTHEKGANRPEKLTEPFRRVFAYLNKSRALNKEIISDVMHKHLLFEDTRHNAVFINSKETMAEIRGANSYVDFKGQWREPGTHDYWFYQPRDKSDRVYICESAIDALSLYQIIDDKNAVYISLSGVGNSHHIIDSILQHGKQIIICTDNDDAGNQVRTDYPHLETLYPINKDWNSDLQQGGLRYEIYTRNKATFERITRLPKTA